MGTTMRGSKQPSSGPHKMTMKGSKDPSHGPGQTTMKGTKSGFGRGPASGGSKSVKLPPS